MQSQDDALYSYAHSIIRATPKRSHDRLSRNAEPDVDESLALLLSWGAEEKSESVSDVVAGDELVGDADTCEPESVKDKGVVGKTWKKKKKKVAKVLATLVMCALMAVLLFWHGAFPMLARMVWN